MRQVIETTLNGVTIGDPIHFRGMSLYPLFQTSTPKQEYVMLRTAFPRVAPSYRNFRRRIRTRTETVQ